MPVSKEQITYHDSGQIKRPDGHLYYAITGQGDEPIIWVHGLPLQSDAWLPQLQYFDKSHRNIVFDLRGYGRSSKLPTTYDSVTQIYVDDIQAVIDALHVQSPIIVGFASAGHGVLRFAATHVDQLSKLVVINGSPCFMKQKDWLGAFDQYIVEEVVKRIDKANSAEEAWAFLSESAFTEPCGKPVEQLNAWYTSMAAEAGKETLKAFFTNIAYDDDRDLMANISVPTLIINSLSGQEVPSETGLFLRQSIAKAQLFEINDIGHFAFATQSGLVNRVIEQFIQPKCDIILPHQKGV